MLEIMPQVNCLSVLERSVFFSSASFKLRKEAWDIKRKGYTGKLRGLLGARVQPLSHQLYIAAEVARRSCARVILADEVGLGKTIEAALIFSSLKALGKADRVLVLCPDALIHQWMAELYRKFGEMFTLLTPQRLTEDESSLGGNPFEMNQRMIISIDELIRLPDRHKQAWEASYDLIIVDEAHHLDWDEEKPHPKWFLVNELKDKTKSLLLLTATPRQHGLCTLFGLLNLVDSQRFHDYDEFLAEQESQSAIAALAQKLEEGFLDEDGFGALEEIFLLDASSLSLLKQWSQNPKKNHFKDLLLKRLVDRHGSGFALIRNRRARLKGFPERNLEAIPLEASEDYLKRLANLTPEKLSQVQLMDLATGRLKSDDLMEGAGYNLRLAWFKDYFKKIQKGEKVLLICATSFGAQKLAQDLRSSRIVCCLFHEGLLTLERDQEAAKFAQSKNVQLLISSEIGSEGRNFQFLKHLILFDLPHHPDLLEQRIGRLDRIGQGKKIHIITPWIASGPEAVLFHWYQEGMNAFQESWNGADPFLDAFGHELLELIAGTVGAQPLTGKIFKTKLDQLIQKTKEFAADLMKEREESTDILLDLNSFDSAAGEKLLEEVDLLDDDPSVEFFLRSVLDHFAVSYEDADDSSSIIIDTEELMFLEEFPGLALGERLTVTFDRAVALQRESVDFISYDHRIVDGAISLFLEKKEGMTSICFWRGKQRSEKYLFELSFVLEPEGKKELDLNYFLPLERMSLQMDEKGQPLKQPLTEKDEDVLEDLDQHTISQMNIKALTQFVSNLVKDAEVEVSEALLPKIAAACEQMKKEREEELSRLEYLAFVNPRIAEEEIRYKKTLLKEGLIALKNCKPKLDAVRIVVC